MSENQTEKPHTCRRCGSHKMTISERRRDISRICQQLERGVKPQKAAELKLKIVELKELIKKQQGWMQEHIDEVTFGPLASR